MGTMSATASARPSSSRLVFLDLARAGAVLFMIQGHTIHQVLDPRYDDTLVFQSWLFLRGLTSCLFFLLSGFAFSIASAKYWDDLRRPSRRVFRRLVRFAFFLAFGYLIHFPMGKFEHLRFASEERWLSFFQVDVLQVVAVSLLLLQALVVLCAERRRFTIAATVIGVAIVMATPFLWARPWVGTVPLWFAPYLSSDTGSHFPLFPWGAFLFLGAALGMAYVKFGTGRPLAHSARALLVFGAAVTVAGVAAFNLPIPSIGSIDPWRAGPTIFAVRFGSTLLLLGGFVWVSRFVPWLPRPIQALSQESLMIYVVHVAVLYGSLWAPGLGQALGRQGVAGTAAWILVLFTSMTVVAWIWNLAKRKRPMLVHAARFAIGVALVWPLL